MSLPDSALSIHTVARILTIKRCADPCSHYSVPIWAKKTGLRDVLMRNILGRCQDFLI